MTEEPAPPRDRKRDQRALGFIVLSVFAVGLAAVILGAVTLSKGDHLSTATCLVAAAVSASALLLSVNGTRG